MRRLSILLTLLLLSAPGVEAAIAFQSASGTNGTSAGGATCTEPAGASSGDVLLGVVLTLGETVVRPAGWTNIFNGQAGDDSWDYDISQIVRGGSAPSLAWTWTGTSYYECHLIRVSGVDATTPVDAVSSTTTGMGDRLTVLDSPSATATTTNALALSLGMHGSGAGNTWVAPTGYTMRSTLNTTSVIGAVASKALVGTGAEDPANYTTAISGVWDWVAMTVILREASGGAVVPRLMLLGVGD